MRFGPDDWADYQARRDELMDDFSAWLPAPLAENIGAGDLQLLLDWKHGYGDGYLGRWRCSDLDEFLLGWCPRKLVVPPSEQSSVPVATSLAMSFLADRRLLDAASDPVDVLVEHAAGLAGSFAVRMTDESSFGLSKSIFAGMGIDDVTDLDPDDLERVMADFNALPFEQRKAITDGALGTADVPDPLVLTGVRLPDAEAVRRSAEDAPVLARFRQLADYLQPPGKVLTAQGNLKISDARALSELLETDDVYEEQIGARTFRKRSATEFTEVDHWQWWAREVGVLRRRHNRLVAVKAWQQRARKDPVAEATRAVDVLLEYGVLNSYGLPMWPVAQVLDASVVALLGRLLQQRSAEYDLLVDVYRELLDTTGAVEAFPGHLERLFDQQLTGLERAGVIAQEGAVHTPRGYGGQDRSGGVVTLTPVGAHIAVRAAERTGVRVEPLPAVEDMGADDLAAMLDGRLGPEQWWEEVGRWLAAQPDADAARSELVSAVARTGPLPLYLALSTAPETQQAALEPLAREIGFGPEHAGSGAASMALNWLLQHDLVDLEACGPELMVDVMVDSATILAADEPAEIIDMVSQGDLADQLRLLEEVRRRGRPNAAQFLEIVGHHHPDKTVSKAARKELFRLRSH